MPESCTCCVQLPVAAGADRRIQRAEARMLAAMLIIGNHTFALICLPSIYMPKPRKNIRSVTKVSEMLQILAEDILPGFGVLPEEGYP